MKLIQKLALDDPDAVLNMISEGFTDCPFHLGYEKYRPDFCDAEWQGNHPCEHCWGREYIQKPLTPEEIKKEAIKKLIELHGIKINQTFFVDGWALNKTTYGHFMFDENLELKTKEDVNTTQMVILMIVCPESIHTYLTPEMAENDIFFLLNPRPIAKEEK